MKIAVDAMGGDHAPKHPVAGALLAARQLGVRVVLVGEEAAIRAELAAHGGGDGHIEVVHAEQAIGMEEPAAVAVRRKRRSSIHVAARLLRDGQVQGFVSAGNTGAVMAVVKVLVGTLEGVDRPALAVVMPTQTGRAVVLDVGANVEPKAEHLRQFAVMGHHFAREILGVHSPRVGLLSIGEEAVKGNELIRRAYGLVRDSGLEFGGNVEARDLFQGRCEVVVCDGFTGNVLLKTGEAAAEMLRHLLREEFTRTWRDRAGAWLARSAFLRFRRRVDYAEFGGAPLLGVRGLTIICHGRSNPRAIRNGVRVAVEYAQHDVSRRIEEALGVVGAAEASAAPAPTTGDGGASPAAGDGGEQAP